MHSWPDKPWPNRIVCKACGLEVSPHDPNFDPAKVEPPCGKPGLGDRVARFIYRWIRSKPCAGCRKRQAWLNRHPRLAMAVSIAGAAFIAWTVLRMLW
jgi:hypothetical protein